MTHSETGTPEDLSEAKLPRRDWILLPLLSLMTIVLLIGSTELIARWKFSGTKTNPFNCIVMNDPSTGYRAIPNSVCYGKLPEAGLVEYKFNSCGHRAGMECGPKSPGDYRIVMIGSSVGWGYLVPREKTFAALLPTELSEQTQRKIELYNESMAGRPPRAIALRFDEALAAKPDLILWQLTPWEIELASQVLPVQDEPSHTSIGSRLGVP
jgi:hypothetical protein